MLDLLILSDEALSQDFHCVDLLVVNFSHKEHFPIGTGADDRDYIKVLFGDLAFLSFKFLYDLFVPSSLTIFHRVLFTLTRA